MKQDMPKLLSPEPFPPFFYQLPKIYLHFQKKIFLQPDAFNFKSLPAFLQ